MTNTNNAVYIHSKQCWVIFNALGQKGQTQWMGGKLTNAELFYSNAPLDQI